MFFDDLHPSAQVHYLLARKVNKYVHKHYKVVDPSKASQQQDVRELAVEEDALIKAFIEKHDYVFAKDFNGFFGGLRNSRVWALEKTNSLNLINIFDHAINRGGDRSYKVLQKLGWIDQDGKLAAINVPAIKEAYERAIDANVVRTRSSCMGN